jgi:NAD(P)-dependent dehydrogenase (short-subunit alcohol dehydrogenase family)
MIDGLRASGVGGGMNELDRFRLDGRAALVAGGSGGIGIRASAALAGVGADVAIAARSAERAEEARSAVEETGSRAIVVAGDMTVEADARRVVAETVERFGRLDVLVNAVGGGAGTALYPAEEYPEAEWDRIVDLNLRSVLLPSQAAARSMIAGGRGGRILNVSSVRGQLGIDAGYSAYVAAKGALNALTRQWATEWAKHGITVNAISPTFVRTPQVESLLADRAFYEALVSRIPLGRIAETDDLVGAILFFCSDASSFVTGQVLTLDGGLTATQ